MNQLTVMSYNFGSMSRANRAAAQPVPRITRRGRPVRKGMLVGWEAGGIPWPDQCGRCHVAWYCGLFGAIDYAAALMMSGCGTALPAALPRNRVAPGQDASWHRAVTDPWLCVIAHLSAADTVLSVWVSRTPFGARACKAAPTCGCTLLAAHSALRNASRPLEARGTSARCHCVPNSAPAAHVIMALSERERCRITLITPRDLDWACGLVMDI
jgi:hypothetical protein